MSAIRRKTYLLSTHVCNEDRLTMWGWAHETPSRLLCLSYSCILTCNSEAICGYHLACSRSFCEFLLSLHVKGFFFCFFLLVFIRNHILKSISTLFIPSSFLLKKGLRFPSCFYFAASFLLLKLVRYLINLKMTFQAYSRPAVHDKSRLR